MLVNPMIGVIVGLLSMLIGFMTYEVCGSWILSSLMFLTAAGLGLCLVDAVSRKFSRKENEGGENPQLDSWEKTK